MISKTVEAFLEKYHLTNSKILVAFSGGYDSMCLLHVLKKLSTKFNIELIAIHLNHNWRGVESDLEEQSCKEFCNDINFYSEKLSDTVPHTETAARDARYDFFKRCADKFNSNIILTAHNANDNAETIFYRMLKGTGLTGLEGIQEHRDIYYRPILEIYRDEILDYCATNNLSPNNDSSNLDTSYARNKIRHEIFPKLKEFSPEFEKKLNKLAKSAQFANSLIESQIKPLEKYIPNEFALLSTEFQNTIIHRFLRDKNLDYDKKRINEIVEFILNTKSSKSGKTISLTTDKWLFVNETQIKVVDKIINNMPEVHITKTGEYKIGPHTFIIQNITDRPKKYPKDEEYLAYVNLTNLNYTLRGKKDGDIIQPLGMKGSQKFKKYLNEKKIPKHEKEQLVLLCDGNEVLWVAGYGINEKIKVVSNPTHMIKLKRGE